MPEMHLTQLGFTCSKCKHFTKNKEEIEKFKETGGSKCIYKSEINKNCFQHDMNDTAYGDCKVLPKRKVADEKLCDKAFNTAKVQNMMDAKHEHVFSGL